MASFGFSFTGDDIDQSEENSLSSPDSVSFMSNSNAVETGSLRRTSNPAFPIVGQPLLQPQSHNVEDMLKSLPSRIAYSSLVIKLDDGNEISIPRRELWDVRVQLMAEEDDESLGNLGKDDVRTGIYEGGFKSWESSVDVVRVLYEKITFVKSSSRVLEVRPEKLYLMKKV
jgi:protein-histidine N-methyltransferase